MRRYQSLGMGIVSALFLGSMIAACSASGNDPNVVGGSGASDSGANADTSYDYGDSASDIPQPDGSTTPKDSGPVVPYDAGPPPPPSNDCDLSGAGIITYFTAAESGGDGACGTDDACTDAADCCVSFASIGIPPEFAAFFTSASAPVCVAR